jgi:hypothetical protein
MAMAGWGTEPYGSLNYHRGECDTSLYFTVWFGIPVWFSFRGCAHLIDVFALRRKGGRLDSIARFVQDYLGVTGIDPGNLPGTIYLPLRSSRALKWMAAYYWALWITGIAAVAAVLDTFAILHSGRALTPGEDRFLIVTWIGAALFVPGLLAYQMIRRPSQRQAQIRAAVADRLGPFSDPADWAPDLLNRLAAAHELPNLQPGSALQAAEAKAVSGKHSEALLLARLAAGLATQPDESFERERAETLTDRCLQERDTA